MTDTATDSSTDPQKTPSAPPQGRQGVMARIRSYTPTLRVQRVLAMLLLIAQGGITVTGSIVRVTGSGLGCNTWPNCHDGSLVPVAGAAPMIQQIIEFGNRLLTFVVAAAALLVFIAMVKAGRRTELKVLAFISGIGVILQAVIGGMSVLLDLQWWAVAVHFLPSMILVWIAAILYTRIPEPDDGTAIRQFPDLIRIMALVAAICLAAVLVTGTMVTGSGPHSGDAGVGMEGRLEVDTRIMTYIHAAAMYIYLAFTLIVIFLLHRAKAGAAVKKTAWVLVAMILVQWAIGITQFYLGVPRWTVPAHIAMSSVVVAFSAFLYAHGRVREGGTGASPTGSPVGDARLAASRV